MSYCRFSEGDVYAYACEGGVQFWVAGGINQLDRLCNTYDSAYQYAKYLRDECGLEVPSHAIDALRSDALEEANHGDGSVVKELISENNKLRDAMFSNAKKHALQHMDEDELRIWATQQSEYIEELRDLVDQYHSTMRCTLETGTWPTDPAYLEERMRELGIEVRHV